MANIDRAAILALVERYSDECSGRDIAASGVTLQKIMDMLGPDPVALAARYREGESLTTIARTTGLAFSTVRQMILSTGTRMRAPGRPRKVSSPSLPRGTMLAQSATGHTQGEEP